MKFTTHNENRISINGTSLVGYINIPYDRVVKVFGEPMEGIDKTDAEWNIKFEDNTVVAIYNCKNGINYLGPNGTPTDLICDWNIGGKHERDISLIKLALGLIKY